MKGDVKLPVLWFTEKLQYIPTVTACLLCMRLNKEVLPNHYIVKKGADSVWMCKNILIMCVHFHIYIHLQASFYVLFYFWSQHTERNLLSSHSSLHTALHCYLIIWIVFRFKLLICTGMPFVCYKYLCPVIHYCLNMAFDHLVTLTSITSISHYFPEVCVSDL